MNLPLVVDAQVVGFDAQSGDLRLWVELSDKEMFLLAISTDELLSRCAKAERAWPTLQLH
jgi:hypothetical protein